MARRLPASNLRRNIIADAYPRPIPKTELPKQVPAPKLPKVPKTRFTVDGKLVWR